MKFTVYPKTVNYYSSLSVFQKLPFVDYFSNPRSLGIQSYKFDELPSSLFNYTGIVKDIPTYSAEVGYFFLTLG